MLFVVFFPLQTCRAHLPVPWRCWGRAVCHAEGPGGWRLPAPGELAPRFAVWFCFPHSLEWSKLDHLVRFEKPGTDSAGSRKPGCTKGFYPLWRPRSMQPLRSVVVAAKTEARPLQDPHTVLHFPCKNSFLRAATTPCSACPSAQGQPQLGGCCPPSARVRSRWTDTAQRTKIAVYFSFETGKTSRLDFLQNGFF